MEKKAPGRPRLYSTASDKVDAFRRRQESAGYQRKEILVTKETWEQLSVLALAHGVSVADAASGLLEYGLETYANRQGSRVPSAAEEGAEPSPSGPTRALHQFWGQAQSLASASLVPDAWDHFGADSLNPNRPTPLFASSVGQGLVVSSSATDTATNSLKDTSKPPVDQAISDNPISRFFNKRKNQHHG